MPSPAEILKGLAAISNDQAVLAVLWHSLLALPLAAVLLGWRPTRKMGATALAVPLLSVAILAWMSGNPFNAIVFLLFAILLAVLGLGLPSARVPAAPAWARVVGIALVAFGWAYPHFLEDAAWTEYLYRAPTGLIPCPTLSVVVGLTLLAGGFGSRAFSLSLGFLAMFYGAFGAFRLGVRIDLVLFAGAIVLLAFAQTTKSPAPN